MEKQKLALERFKNQTLLENFAKEKIFREKAVQTDAIQMPTRLPQGFN